MLNIKWIVKLRCFGKWDLRMRLYEKDWNWKTMMRMMIMMTMMTGYRRRRKKIFNLYEKWPQITYEQQSSITNYKKLPSISDHFYFIWFFPFTSVSYYHSPAMTPSTQKIPTNHDGSVQDILAINLILALILMTSHFTFFFSFHLVWSISASFSYIRDMKYRFYS